MWCLLDEKNDNGDLGIDMLVSSRLRRWRLLKLTGIYGVQLTVKAGGGRVYVPLMTDDVNVCASATTHCRRDCYQRAGLTGSYWSERCILKENLRIRRLIRRRRGTYKLNVGLCDHDEGRERQCGVWM